MPNTSSNKRKGRMIHVRLTEENHKKLRMRVAELDTTIQEWVAAMVERELCLKKRKRSLKG
jgi:DNA-binding MarR family transcriptional regulator